MCLSVLSPYTDRAVLQQQEMMLKRGPGNDAGHLIRFFVFYSSFKKSLSCLCCYAAVCAAGQRGVSCGGQVWSVLYLTLVIMWAASLSSF